jgi:hypothetical protein
MIHRIKQFHYYAHDSQTLNPSDEPSPHCCTYYCRIHLSNNNCLSFEIWCIVVMVEVYWHFIWFLFHVVSLPASPQSQPQISRFNINFQPSITYSKWFPNTFSDKNFVCDFRLPIWPESITPIIIFDLTILTIFDDEQSYNTGLVSSSSSSSSSIFHGVGPLVDPFRSHVSRSLIKGLPWFLLPVGE